MALIDLIDEDVVKVPMQSTTKTEVFRELIDVLVGNGKVSNVEQALNAVLERESMGSTGLGYGIAVPHAKTNAVNSLCVAVGIAPHGIEFEALDGEPSTLFFLLLAPPDQSGPHIEALSEIARMSKSKSFLRAIVASTTPAELVEMLRE